jgi:hypothetical protein
LAAIKEPKVICVIPISRASFVRPAFHEPARSVDSR